MFVFLICGAPQFLAQGGFNFSFFFSQIQTGLVSATGSKYIGGESGSGLDTGACTGAFTFQGFEFGFACLISKIGMVVQYTAVDSIVFQGVSCLCDIRIASAICKNVVGSARLCVDLDYAHYVSG